MQVQNELFTTMTAALVGFIVIIMLFSLGDMKYNGTNLKHAATVNHSVVF